MTDTNNTFLNRVLNAPSEEIRKIFIRALENTYGHGPSESLSDELVELSHRFRDNINEYFIACGSLSGIKLAETLSREDLVTYVDSTIPYIPLMQKFLKDLVKNN
jgi:hypothetical protein